MTSIGQWEMAQTCAKLESNAVVVGIDVSKDHLDAAQYPSGDLIQTSNDTKGLRTLLRWIGRQRAVHVVFEATGPFHRQLESHLAKAGIPFHGSIRGMQESLLKQPESLQKRIG